MYIGIELGIDSTNLLLQNVIVSIANIMIMKLVDVTITTIRDNYNDTREIKDILRDINNQLEYMEENLREILELVIKGE